MVRAAKKKKIAAEIKAVFISGDLIKNANKTRIGATRKAMSIIEAVIILLRFYKKKAAQRKASGLMLLDVLYDVVLAPADVEPVRLVIKMEDKTDLGSYRQELLGDLSGAER